MTGDEKELRLQILACDRDHTQQPEQMSARSLPSISSHDVRHVVATREEGEREQERKSQGLASFISNDRHCLD